MNDFMLKDDGGIFYTEEYFFKVSIFENASDVKNSCLVKIQLQEVDRVSFQGLVSHVRSKAKHKYAFTFDDEARNIVPYMIFKYFSDC